MIGLLTAQKQQQASVKYGLLFEALRHSNSMLGCARLQLLVPAVPGHMQRQDQTGWPAEGL